MTMEDDESVQIKPPLPLPLPLPRAGRIDEVIHVSDIHIPFVKQELHASNSWRLDQHASVISRLIDSVWNLPSVKEGRAVVLVAGDVLDCRRMANATTIKLVQDLFVGICSGNNENIDIDGRDCGKNDGSFLPVYVTAGNHDIRLETVSSTEGGDDDAEDDLLGAILAPLSERIPVKYMKKSGIYGTIGTGVVFGLLHIRDVMMPGNCSGDARNAEDIPLHAISLEDTSVKQSDDSKILVYHGQVAGYRLLSSNNEHVDNKHVQPPVPSIASEMGYDACMFGDVHTMQFHGMVPIIDDKNDDENGIFSWGSNSRKPLKKRSNKAFSSASAPEIPWAYSGSLLQLNAGERLFPHGYLCWSLASKTVRAIHVNNEYGTLFCSYNDEGRLRIHNAVSPTCDAGMPEPMIVDESHPPPAWFPKQAAVRLVCGGAITYKTMDTVRNVLEKSCGVRVIGDNRSVVPSTINNLENENDVADTENSSSNITKTIDLSCFGRPQTWVDYIRCSSSSSTRDGDGKEGVADWEMWLYRPETLCVDAIIDGLPDAIGTKVGDRNSKILKKCAECAGSSHSSSSAAEGGSGGGCVAAKTTYSLRCLRWSWLLCYGENNIFDFSLLNGRVALLSASNGSGKSAMLEVVCIALFGQSMPSRGGKSTLADALCRWRPQESTPACCSIDVCLGGSDESLPPTVYRIARTFSASASSSRVTSSARVSKIVPPNETLVTIKDGISAVNSWTASHIGSISDFLLSSLLTQNGDADFFGMKPADQKALLDEALALDAARAMCDVLKDAKLAHASVLDSIQTAMETSLKTALQDVHKLFSIVADNNSTDINIIHSILKEKTENTQLLAAKKKVELERLRDTFREVQVREETLRSHLRGGGEKTEGLNEEEKDDENCKEEPRESRIAVDICPEITFDELERMRIDQETWASQWPDEWLDGLDTVRLNSPSSSCPEQEHTRLQQHAESGGFDDIERYQSAKNDAYLRFIKSRDNFRDISLHPPPSVCEIDDDFINIDVETTKNEVCAKKRDLESIVRNVESDDREAEKMYVSAKNELAASVAMAKKTVIRDDENDVERLLEQAKREQADAKEARRAYDAEQRSVDEFREVIRKVDPEGWEGVGLFQSVRPIGPNNAYFESVEKQWRERREIAVNDWKRVNTRRSNEEREDIYDSVYRSIEANLDECASVLDIATDTLKPRGRKGEQGDDNDASLYDPSCLACIKRRCLREGNAKDREAIVLRMRTCKGRMVCDDDNEYDDDDVLSLYSSLCKSYVSSERWFNTWKSNAFSRACGSDDMEAQFRENRVAHARLEYWTRLRSTENAKEEAERLATAYKKTKSVYIDACAKKESREANKERERDALRSATETVQAYEKERQCITDLRNDIERMEQQLEQNRVVRIGEEFKERLKMASEEMEAASKQLDRASAILDEKKAEVEDTVRMNRRAEAFKEAAFGPGGWIERRSKYIELLGRYTEWAIAAKREVRKCSRKTESLRENIQKLASISDSLSSDASVMEMALGRFSCWRATYDAWSDYRDRVELKKGRIEQLCGVMGGFTSWVYTRRALPSLMAEVNALLASMNVDTKLEGFCKAEEGSSLAWTLNGTPITKSSGMQRFSASLAMRVALSQLGACSSTCRQLIIDEGFVTLDGKNISHVPEFLHEGIIDTGRFSSVLLVSHLEGVREAADTIVPIKTKIVRSSIGGSDGTLSCVRYSSSK
jgi:hypothetical protein